MITFEDGTTGLKPEVEWTNVEDNEDIGNSKALNSIFNGVDKNMFRLINTCTETNMLGIFTRLLMNVHPMLGCQGCNSLLQSLKI